MKFYWTLKSLPELQGIDKRSALKIWRKAARRAMKDPKYWLAFLPAGVCAGIGSIIGGPLGTGLGAGIGAGLSTPFYFNAARPHVADVVAEWRSRKSGESDGQE